MSAPKSITLAMAALLLTACQTMTPEERRAADEDKCASYGFRRNTEAFATCLQRIDLDRRADARSLRYSSYNSWGWDRPAYVMAPIVVRPRY